MSKNLLKKWDISPEDYEAWCNTILEIARVKTLRADVVLMLVDLFANGDIPPQEATDETL